MEYEKKHIDDNNMFYEIIREIRNLKELNKEQLEYIKTLPNEKLLELLLIYNNCFYSINYFFDSFTINSINQNNNENNNEK